LDYLWRYERRFYTVYPIPGFPLLPFASCLLPLVYCLLPLAPCFLPLASCNSPFSSIAMYIVKMPALVQRLFPGFTWRMPVKEKILYLTFDDGPIPEVTPWVLDTLRAAGAKATFFCVGENVQRYPAIFQRILAEGHSVGNHTHQHLNGWKNEDAHYLNNVAACARLVPGRLFRPPYGRLRSSQAKAIRNQHQIVMWDVLSGDFDRNISPEKCLDNILRHCRPGSIVVLHDSIKAAPNMRHALTGLLQHFGEKGWSFEPIMM